MLPAIETNVILEDILKELKIIATTLVQQDRRSKYGYEGYLPDLSELIEQAKA